MFFLLFVIALIVAIVMYVRLQTALKQKHEALAHAAQVQTWAQGQVAQSAAQQSAALDARARRAVAASRGSFDGHIAEQAFPVAPHHRYHPKDIFHLGGVMDYLVFDGLHDVRNGQRDPKTITVIFADVKWGSSRLSDVQRAVMDAVNEGRMRAEQWAAREEGQGELSYVRRELR